MIERFLIAAALLAIGVVAYLWQTRTQLRRIAEQHNHDPLLSDFSPGTPAIVYFTTPGCVPCKTQQQPALQRLRESLGNRVQIFQFDATEVPDAADRWGVMSAPTTFVLNADGEPKAVNHGVADERKLTQQLESVAA